MADEAEAEPRKEPMPDQLRPLAEAAIARHRKRPCAPEIVSKPDHGFYQNLTCPYREEDEDLWMALLLECFGTRSYEVGQCFFRQLEALCPDVLYEGETHSRRDEETLRQALAIVYSLKPRNEAEAALAAQYVALHLTTMKVGAEIGRRSYCDPRTAATLAALSKASSAAMTAIQNAQGRGRKSLKQTIVVKKETRIYDQRQVHLHREGGRNAGGQPHGSDELRAREGSAGRTQELQALPSSDTNGDIVPFPGSEGPEPLSPTRRRAGQRRTQG